MGILGFFVLVMIVFATYAGLEEDWAAPTAGSPASSANST